MMEDKKIKQSVTKRRNLSTIAYFYSKGKMGKLGKISGEHCLNEREDVKMVNFLGICWKEGGLLKSEKRS